jgi:hypothetical protein
MTQNSNEKQDLKVSDQILSFVSATRTKYPNINSIRNSI